MLKNGTALVIIRKRPIASTGEVQRKISAIFAFMEKAITMEKISINGARMAVLIIIIYAISTLVTSVVSLVTSEEVENLSMLAKEKSCIL